MKAYVINFLLDYMYKSSECNKYILKNIHEQLNLLLETADPRNFTSKIILKMGKSNISQIMFMLTIPKWREETRGMSQVGGLFWGRCIAHIAIYFPIRYF